ncbi:MAG: cupin domain-containing protein [Candidatus Eisenbacteria bacterium]
MNETGIPFRQLPWQPGGHPLERKKSLPGARAAMLAFEPGFADPNWCARGHAGYVLGGALRFELRNGSLTIEQGDGFEIDAGTEHRAGNPGSEPVVLFIVSWDEDAG